MVSLLPVCLAGNICPDGRGRAVIDISDVVFSAAGPSEVEKGVLGFITCVINGAVRLDGVTLRRTLDGRLTLSFPARRDGLGRSHYYIRPVGDSARRSLERQVFQALAHEIGT